MAESPTAAFVFSLLGGVFVSIGGIVLIGIGFLFDALGDFGGIASLPGGLSLPGGIGNMTSIAGGASGAGVSIAAFGGLGILLGIAMIVLAIILHRSPARHQLCGALILVFSMLSWVGAIGGLVIGFLFGVVGGALAISWKPGAVQAPAVQVTRICPNCGTVIQKDMKFCPYCGKALP